MCSLSDDAGFVEVGWGVRVLEQELVAKEDVIG